MMQLLLNYHWLTPGEASRLLSKSGRNVGAEFRALLGNLAGTDDEVLPASVHQVQTLSSVGGKKPRSAKGRKKAVQNAFRPSSAAVEKGGAGEFLFTACEGRKIAPVVPRPATAKPAPKGPKRLATPRTGARPIKPATKVTISLPQAESATGPETLQKSKPRSRPTTRGGPKRGKPAKRNPVLEPAEQAKKEQNTQVQNCVPPAEQHEQEKPAEEEKKELYFDYLSPEKGCGEGIVEEYKRFAEQETNECVLPHPRSTKVAGLTPAHKLLYVNPATFSGREQQAKKLMLLIAQKSSAAAGEQKRRRKKKSKMRRSKRPGSSLRTRTESARKKRPVSCRPRISSRKSPQRTEDKGGAKQCEPSGERPKTVLTKYNRSFSAAITMVKGRPVHKGAAGRGDNGQSQVQTQMQQQQNSAESSFERKSDEDDDYLSGPKIPATIEEICCEDSEDRGRLFTSGTSRVGRQRQPMKLRYATLADSYVPSYGKNKQMQPSTAKTRINVQTSITDRNPPKRLQISGFSTFQPSHTSGNRLQLITPTVCKLGGPMQPLRKVPESPAQRAKHETHFAELLARQFRSKVSPVCSDSAASTRIFPARNDDDSKQICGEQLVPAPTSGGGKAEAEARQSLVSTKQLHTRFHKPRICERKVLRDT